ncbi:MAG: GHMP kinase [Kineosporiaceae bacterium]
MGTGVGLAQGHHGEVLQGAFHLPGSGLRRALVTMPLPRLASTATVVVDEDLPPGTVLVEPGDKSKSCRAAAAAFRFCTDAYRVPLLAGRLTIRTAVESGLGMGASTTDVVAAIRAVANLHRLQLRASDVAGLSVRAEGASDSIMFEDRVVLFAHRDGVVLDELGPHLPPLVVVGCITGAQRHVDTLQLPPARYDADELRRLGVLLAALRHAVRAGDPKLLGRVATGSARINQRFLPKPELEDMIGIGRRHGALGVQVAHSGSVAGILFDPADAAAATGALACVADLAAAGVTCTGVFPGTGAAVAAR